MKVTYAMQDALSLLVMTHRPIGRGIGCVSKQTAGHLVDRGYAVVRDDGDLEVTDDGRTEYDAALARAHADKGR